MSESKLGWMPPAESKHRVVVVARDVVIGDADIKQVLSDRGTTTIIFDRRVAERRQHDRDHTRDRRRGVDRRGQSGNRSEPESLAPSRGSLRWLVARWVDLAVGTVGVLLVLVLIGLMRGQPALTHGIPPAQEGPATAEAPPRMTAVHEVEPPPRPTRAVRSKAISPRVADDRASPQNEIRQVRTVDVSAEEVSVSLAYRYAGDHGRDQVFIHAAALQGDDLVSRVPGTGFPGAPIGVGSGSVTITIGRLLGMAPAASTSIRVCMVSLRTRSAFVCETFPFAKSWGPLQSAESADPSSLDGTTGDSEGEFTRP